MQNARIPPTKTRPEAVFATVSAAWLLLATAEVGLLALVPSSAFHDQHFTLIERLSLVAIPAADVASAGSRQITVANPARAGGVSNTAALTITSDHPASTITSLSHPAITSLSHPAVAVGRPGFTLTVTGGAS